MDKIKKIVLNLSIASFSMIVLISALFLIIRHKKQVNLKKLTKIDSEHGIDREETINLNGIPQKILIRSENIRNPVLLFLHGGISAVAMPLSRYYENKLVKHFTLVHWDRRGVGKSYRSNIHADSLTIDILVSDTILLSKYLREKQNKQKIYLLGLSFGSVIGLKTVFLYPDIFYAYIGVGQIVDMKKAEKISYDYTMMKAKEMNDLNALHVLTRIGETPYDNYDELLEQRKWLRKFGGDFHKFKNLNLLKIQALFSPDYSLSEIWKTYKGLEYEEKLFWNHYNEVNFPESIRKLDTPVIFMGGRYDYKVPSILAEEYLNMLEVPKKEFIWFENSGHAPNYEEPKMFQDKLIEVLYKTNQS